MAMKPLPFHSASLCRLFHSDYSIASSIADSATSQHSTSHSSYSSPSFSLNFDLLDLHCQIDLNILIDAIIDVANASALLLVDYSIYFGDLSGSFGSLLT